MSKRAVKGLAALRPALFAFLSSAVLLTGCASTSGGPDAQASQSGLNNLVLMGGPFTLQAFDRAGPQSHAHVFIEGDGRPWRAGGRVVSEDPTPKRLLALGWMREVPGPVLYLGRPCYFTTEANPSCDPLLWTYGRYSELVVQSMAAGLQDWLRHRPHITSVTLVGHSGGGVLALLLAEGVPVVNEVVAVSTPVDIDVWTGMHRYTPLFASLNPARQQSWRKGVLRRLYFGQNDRQVPPEAFIRAARDLPGAMVRVVEGADHDCCGPSVWLAPRQLDAAHSSRPGGS
ncbi:PGAP1-like alpha/beta domain-containing protein [Halopseudomonas salina]|uniref:PGAP1-like alpha/beta domain-containing protein n=1 Tax=Halopseudomonas salina TaxID=1323744 RepID=UPI00123A6A66|nr:alpha/beta fold hydrolase [Halopseudomonas salina]